MPTYQYLCTECGEALEAQQSFSDDALTVCPVCSGRLRKVFNAVGVVFKGSGFYRNDSRSTTTTSEPATSSDPKPTKESTDAKPAASEGTKPASTGSSTTATGAA